MPWIEAVPEHKARGALRAVYDRIAGARGKVSNVMRVQSLHPEPMRAHLDLYLAVLFGRSGLRRAERELIAAYFNFVNRVAEGLGVAFTEEEVTGYRY